MALANEFDASTIAYTPTSGVHEVFETRLVSATAESLKGYGRLVEAPQNHKTEIVRWPAQGWRPVDANSGDQGGVTEGVFELWWKGDTLYARNNAVGDNYLFAWSRRPEEAAVGKDDADDNGDDFRPPSKVRARALIWRANYHPDGGQMLLPLDGQSFVVPLALPGDDVTPDQFVALHCGGTRGLYIHPNIWHGPIVPIDDHARFLDRQGRVHARVSVDFAKEFGGYLSVPLHGRIPSG